MGQNSVASLMSVKTAVRDPEFHQTSGQLRQSKRWSVFEMASGNVLFQM